MWHFHLCVNINLFSSKPFLFSILPWRLIVQNQIESLLKICSLVWPLPGLPMEIPVHTYPRISHPEKCYSPSRFILHLKWQRGTLGKRKLSQTDFSFLSSCLEGRVGGLVIQWHVHLPLCKILTWLPLKIFHEVNASCVDSISAASFILGGNGYSIEFSHFQTNEYIEEVLRKYESLEKSYFPNGLQLEIGTSCGNIFGEISGTRSLLLCVRVSQGNSLIRFPAPSLSLYRKWRLYICPAFRGSRHFK